jgi:hypothetical protein
VAGAAVSADRDNLLQGMRAAMSGLLGEQKVLTGDDGAFTLDDLPEGPYTVVAKLAGRPDAQLANVPTDARGVKVQFAPEAILAGVVVDGGGKPVVDYNIAAIESAAGDDPARAADRVTKRVVAMFGMGRQSVHDAGGAFELRGLGAGRYDVLVNTADGRVGKVGDLTVTAGQRKGDLRVVVKAGVVAHGKVVEFLRGNPISGMPVLLLDAEQPRMQMANPDGTFRLDGLAGGGSVQITIGGPMTAFVADTYKVKLPVDRTEVDLGTFKLVRGTSDPRPSEGTLGMLVDVKDGQAVVSNVDPQSAAFDAGLTRGDRIRTIDEHEVAGVGEAGLRHLLSGPPGTKVRMGVTGANGQMPRTVQMERRPRAKRPPPAQTSQAPSTTPPR